MFRGSPWSREVHQARFINISRRRAQSLVTALGPLGRHTSMLMCLFTALFVLRVQGMLFEARRRAEGGGGFDTPLRLDFDKFPGGTDGDMSQLFWAI